MTPHKWRPTLTMIVTAMVAMSLLLPLSGIFFFRLYENQLIRNTEGELIAQSAALAAAMSAWLESNSDDDLPIGRELTQLVLPEGENWAPVTPQISLGSTQILPSRPDAEIGNAPVFAIYNDVGAFLFPIMLETQQATLAGFRVLDFNGTVIAGRSEVGMSLAHLPEVQNALLGDYTSALRERVVDNPQPIYSISRGTNVRLFTAMPVKVNNRLAGVIYASRTPSNVVKELYLMRDTLALIVVGITLVAGLMIFVFTRAISSPVKKLATRAQRIGAGEREAIGPMLHYGSREVQQLADELMATAQKFFDRNDYINTFVAHVSHEMKSPLTSIRGAVELLENEPMSPDDQKRFLANIARDTERGTQLLDRLRALAKAESVDIAGQSALKEVVNAARAKFRDVRIELEGDAMLPLSAENGKIIFDNLIENASRHGATTVCVSHEQVGNSVFVTVDDDGDGISEGNRAQVFDMFFTTRRETGGTGLGLAIVDAIIRAHNGKIVLVENDNATAFQMALPLSRERGGGRLLNGGGPVQTEP